ncbi:GL10617, partial [Drosophila persimilis]
LKCRDPCPGVCALNAACRVINHLPTCHCLSGFLGDPYSYCRLPEKPPLPPLLDVYRDPCLPSPCGQYAECRDNQGSATCTCLTA